MPLAADRLPREFLDRLPRLFPPRLLESVRRAYSTPRPTTLRANVLKTSPRELRAELLGEGFKLEEVPGVPGAFVLRNRTRRDLERTAAWREGRLYMQGLSSQLPPLVLGPRPGEAVLDLAAAPGGKTCQMASLMGNQGVLVAVERNPVRAQKLRANLERQGARAEVRVEDGGTFGRRRPDAFDRVLLDAPCGAEGRFDPNQPSTFRYWSLSRVRENAKLQRRLLRSAFAALKRGGTLVYATCTLSPEENEAVVASLLASESAAVLEPAGLALSGILPGLTKWEGEEYGRPMRRAVRVVPSSKFEGFFWAKIRKKETWRRKSEPSRQGLEKALRTQASQGGERTGI